MDERNKKIRFYKKRFGYCLFVFLLVSHGRGVEDVLVVHVFVSPLRRRIRGKLNLSTLSLDSHLSCLYAYAYT